MKRVERALEETGRGLGAHIDSDTEQFGSDFGR